MLRDTHTGFGPGREGGRANEFMTTGIGKVYCHFMELGEREGIQWTGEGSRGRGQRGLKSLRGESKVTGVFPVLTLVHSFPRQLFSQENLEIPVQISCLRIIPPNELNTFYGAFFLLFLSTLVQRHLSSYTVK